MPDDSLFGDEEAEGEFDEAGDEEAEGEFDEAGDEEAEGEFDEAGARRRRPRRRGARRVSVKKAGAANAMAASYGPNPFGGKGTPGELQIPSTSIAAGGTATITVACGQPLMKPNVIKTITSAGLLATSIQVGSTNVNQGSGSIDLTSYANPQDVVNFAHCPTVSPSLPLVFQVSNPTAGAISISGFIRGWVYDRSLR